MPRLIRGLYAASAGEWWCQGQHSELRSRQAPDVEVCEKASDTPQVVPLLVELIPLQNALQAHSSALRHTKGMADAGQRLTLVLS